MELGFYKNEGSCSLRITSKKGEKRQRQILKERRYHKNHQGFKVSCIIELKGEGYSIFWCLIN